MKCNDCNGSGAYQGFYNIDICKTCNGTGEVTIAVPDTLPVDLNINGGLKEGRRPMIPSVGERIYYYREDIEGHVSKVDVDDKSFEAKFINGYGHGSFSDLVWNITNDRWEITRTRN